MRGWSFMGLAACARSTLRRHLAGSARRRGERSRSAVTSTGGDDAQASSREPFPRGAWRAYRFPEDTQRVADRDLVTGHRGQRAALRMAPGIGTPAITLTSVGIDIGSSTSHLMFSRLTLEPRGPVSPSSYIVVEREITYESAIRFTPYATPTMIDTGALAGFIAEAYRDAGVARDDIETGAAIITGEAATKVNAPAVTALFAEEAGKFVCACAGPNLEAAMAAYGSGAVFRSTRQFGAGRTVLNVDIGGGTAKFAVCRGGRVVETAALSAGARLVALDAKSRIVRIEPAGRIVAEALGIPLALGDPLPEADLVEMADALARCILAVALPGPLDALSERLLITAPLSQTTPVDAICFSGGVAEYVYGTEERSFGDLGPALGRALKARTDRLGLPVESPDERIRATVVGAALHTVQVTGNTVLVSRPSLLPRRNLRVVAPLQPEVLTVEAVRAAIFQAMQRSDLRDGEDTFAISFRWVFDPSYQVLKTMALGIVAALPGTLARRRPVILIFDVDIGGAMGSLLEREVIPGHDLISLDELHLGDLDYVDLGTEIENTRVVPVAVKSLVFATERQRSLGLIGDAGADGPESGGGDDPP